MVSLPNDPFGDRLAVFFSVPPRASSKSQKGQRLSGCFLRWFCCSPQAAHRVYKELGGNDTFESFCQGTNLKDFKAWLASPRAKAGSDFRDFANDHAMIDVVEDRDSAEHKSDLGVPSLEEYASEFRIAQWIQKAWRQKVLQAAYAVYKKNRGPMLFDDFRKGAGLQEYKAWVVGPDSPEGSDYREFVKEHAQMALGTVPRAVDHIYDLGVEELGSFAN